MLLMGIDIGTSSAKAIIINSSGAVVATGQLHYGIDEPLPGHRVQQADMVLNATLAAVQQACAQLPAGSAIQAIGFSAAMHSVMAVDQHGTPLTPLILWADTRSQPQAHAIKALGSAQELYMQTGVPVHPMTPLCKIMWLQQHQPQVVQQADKFVSIKEYVLFRLTGRWVVDYSIAASTGMFNIHTLQWHLPALQLAGIPPNRLSQPVAATAAYKPSPEGQQLLKVPGTPLLVAGGSDGCLANIGSSVQPGDVAVTISTSMAVRVTTGKPLHDPQAGIFNYVMAPGMFVSGGGSNNGSFLLGWMAENLLEDVALIAPEAFMALALSAPPGCDGLVMLPYILGERAPVWDANASGIVHGLKMHHRRRHLARALVEGIAMNACLLIERLQHLSGGITTIQASGGFTNSPGWVQILADVSGLPVKVRNAADASAIGAIVIAGNAVGLFDNWQLPWQPVLPSGTCYTPTLHPAYSNNFDLFKNLYTNNF